MDPYLQIQKTVKDNATELEKYMLDLKNWEDGAKKKERDVVYCKDKDVIEEEKKSVTRSDVEYVKAAFEDGCRQMKNKKWNLAESSFSNAIRKYSKNPAFFIKRAKCYIKLKKPIQAEQDCTSALAIDPKILKAKFQRSQAREMKGNLRGACLDLQDILILDPSNQIAKSALGRLKPLYDEELRKEGYQSIDEEDISNKVGKGDSILESLVGTEESADAAASNEERIQLANAEKEKGNNYVKLEKWVEAKEAYSKAIELNPNDPIFYANRALCYLKIKEEPRAILDCCMALKKNPRYVKVYMRRAAAKKATGDLWGARYDVKQVLALEPNNSQAKEDLEQLNLLIEKEGYDKLKVLLKPETKKEQPTPVMNKPADTSVNIPQEFINLLPVNKPLHLRSKKPLKRIPIKFITDTEKRGNSSNCYISPQEFREIILKEKKKPIIFEEKEESIKAFLDGCSKEKIRTENKESTGPRKVNKKVSEKTESNILNEINKLESDSSSADFQYVLPINKKPHLRSKKPLMRIKIKFI